MGPHLATHWGVTPDGKKAIIGLRRGVPWNSPPGVDVDFGEFTAEDVAWWLNNNNATTNPESTSGDAGSPGQRGGSSQVS